MKSSLSRKKISLIGIFFLFGFFFFNTSDAATLFPGNISSCGELMAPGIYNLTQDISGGSSTCFTIGSDNVVINGGGFTISGTGSVAIDARVRTGGPATPLREGASAYTNLIVNQLIISGYTTGIDLSGNDDTSGTGQANGYGGDGGDVAIYYSRVGSISSEGGDSTTKQSGGRGGNISFTDYDLNISNSTFSLLGGTGTLNQDLNGSIDFNYTGTLTKTNVQLSALSFLNDNSTQYGVYVGGTWPMLAGNISTCGTLYGPGTFTLTQSISGISGSCFVIATNDVTLNGGGYTISATSSNTSYAVNAYSFSNFVFASTTVTNYTNLLTASSTATISGDSVNLSNKKINAPSLIVDAGTLNVASTTFYSTSLDLNYSTSITGTSTASSTALTSLKVNNLDYGIKNSGLIFTESWIAKGPSKTWYGIASSLDGKKVIGVSANTTDYIYISNDYGDTWATTTSAGLKSWTAVSSSADGMVLAAVANNDYVYVSTDGGVTWSARENTRTWTSVEVSADGTKIFAGAGYIYVSNDTGKTWYMKMMDSSRTWTSIASSADGSKLIASASNNYIFTSIDGGATWATSTASLGTKSWKGIDISADGTKMIAAAQNNYVYVSTTSGATWATSTASLGTRSWTAVNISADGTKMAALIGGTGAYISYDGGLNWIYKAGGNVNYMSMSLDGTRLYANGNGLVFVFKNFSPTLSVDIILPQANNNITVWSPKISWGIAKYCYYSYDNFVSTSTADCSLNGADITAPSVTGSSTLYIKAFGNLGSVILSKSVTFNNYTNPQIRINSPRENLNYETITWSPNVTYSLSNANLTACYYSYDNFVSTSTADCSLNGRDILPPTHGVNTLYIKTIDTQNNINVSMLSFNYNSTVNTQNSGSRYWSSITSDSTGTKIAATVGSSGGSSFNGYIYTSTTSGTTWATSTNSGVRSWRAITSSADGTNLAAVDNPGYIYTSTTSGATWVQRATTRNWLSISSDTTGNKLVAGSNILYYSSDAGATWTTSTAPTATWSFIDSSNDGVNVIASAYNGYIYTSTTSGQTWATSTNSGSRAWKSVASNSTGSKLVGVVSSGYVYISNDYGNTWTPQLNEVVRSWVSVSMSDDGNKIAAVVQNGKIFYSEDGGLNWVEKGSNYSWSFVKITPDGSKLFASVDNSYIYTINLSFDYYVNTYSIINSPSANEFLTSFSWAPSVNWGFNKTTCLYSYNSFVSSSSANCLLNGSDISAPLVDGVITLYLRSIDILNNISNVNVTFNYYANGWTQRDSQRNWIATASDLVGNKVIAAESSPGYLFGYIYTSLDSGNTWTQRIPAGNRYWTSVSSSFDGTKLAATAYNGYIYTSTDSGVTWTERAASLGIKSWYSITSSLDGTKLAAAADNSHIYTSSDSGVTWATSSISLGGTKNWNMVKSSADGSTLVAIATRGSVQSYIYVSTTSGATWATSTNSGSRYWSSIALDSTGTKITASVGSPSGSFYDGYIYSSTDTGATWTTRTDAGFRSWRSVTSSLDGSRLIAAVNGGYVYSSTNGGSNWATTTNAFSGAKNWSAVTSSGDGTKLFASVASGYLYNMTVTPRVLYVDPVIPKNNSIVTSWSPIISWGSATSCYYSYDNFNSTSTADCSLYGADIQPPTTSGSNTLYVKGIDASSTVDIASTTFTFNTHYFCGTVDSNWSNVNNWYTSNSCSVNTGSLPATTSAAFLVGTTSPIINSSTTTLPMLINSTGLTGAANTSGIIFASSTRNTTKIVGNVTFNDTSYNTGTIIGNAIFSSATNGVYTLTGNMVWGGTISGTKKGGDNIDITSLIFNNSSSNTTTINNMSVVFNDGASNYGIINGDATFNNTSLFTMGTVNGTPTLNGFSQTLSGINNVINFVKRIITPVRDILYLSAGSTLNVSGSTTILGYDANNLLSIRSTTPGVSANLGINGTQNLYFLRLKDIFNTGSPLNLSSNTIFDDLGNSGFNFGASSTPTQRNGMTSMYLSEGEPVFPGQISICGNLYFAGTYTLSNDVVGNCNILESGITIEGSGHTLTGNVTANQYGVTLSDITVTGEFSTTGDNAGTTTVTNASNLSGNITLTGPLVGDSLSTLGNTTIATSSVVATSSVRFVGNVTNNGLINSNNPISGSLINNGTIIGGGSIGGNLTNTGTISGNSSIGGNLINNGTLDGNVNVTGNLTNTGTINGDNTIGGNLVNSGTLTGDNNVTGTLTNSGTIDGSNTASGGVINNNILTGDVVLNFGSINNGVIDGNAIFNATSTNNGTTTGQATLNDYSVNNGMIQGATILNSFSLNAGTIDDDATFNASSTNSGTVTGNANFNSFTSVSGRVTFDGDTEFFGTGEVLGLVKDSAENLITGWVFNDSSSNNGFTVGDAFFNGSSTNSAQGTVSGNAHFNGSSTNLGVVKLNADVYYGVITPLTGIVEGTVTYHSYPNEASFVNNSGTGDWNDPNNWFTDTTFDIPLENVPNQDDSVVLFASTTLSSNINNDVYIAVDDVTIDGRNNVLDGFVTGNGFFDGEDAVDFNLTKIVVTGTTTSNGATGITGTGGDGGDIIVSTSTTASILSLGANGKTNGGSGGTIRVVNSFARPALSFILSSGGSSYYCGDGGSGGQITLTNSSYGGVVVNAGDGTNDGCDNPGETHNPGISYVPSISGEYGEPGSPNDIPTPSQDDTNNESNSVVNSKIFIPGIINKILLPIRNIEPINLTTLPMFGVDGKGSFSFLKSLERFLFAPLPSYITAHPSLANFLIREKVSNEQSLLKIKNHPLRLTDSDENISGIYNVYTRGVPSRSESGEFEVSNLVPVHTVLTLDDSNMLIQRLNTRPGKILEISLKPTVGGVMSGNFLNEKIAFRKDGDRLVASITAPEKSGTYTFTTVASPVPLVIKVVQNISDQSDFSEEENQPLWLKIINFIKGIFSKIILVF